ncbi:MAG TPA: hypothetical protein DDW76_02385 [Cyanobacteria bacterium UBA11369]|nr:hypothetical protein [Cyanobacteria bacterium UBA11371]HBE32105.1 hypothetical protein [Cyanobacteria bacterium UBA11368]HBE47676.1 hypothetical protein [Cyanobacteria bacterium UBA11369]
MQRYIISLGIVLGIWVAGCSPWASNSSSNNNAIAIPQATPSPTSEFRGQMLPISATATIAGKTINLEVTRTPEQQALGLMYRTSLPDDRGMLFEFNPPQQVSFWMKNVKIPLDMIFLRQGVVRAIAANVPPCNANPCPSYGPNTPIDQVIELRGGRASQLGLRVGDRIGVRFLPNSSQP